MYSGSLMNQAFMALGSEVGGGIDAGKERLRELADNGVSYATVAKQIQEILGRTITRQNVRYWVKIVKKNKAHVDRTTQVCKVNKRKRARFNPKVHEHEFDGTTIMVISDTHAPYHHRDILAFYKGVRDKYRPDLVIHGGDEVDNHALSMHDSDPNLNSAGPELNEARKFIHALHALFPKMMLVESNHGSLHYRRAKKFGIPVEYMRTYKEILFPERDVDWTWHPYLRVVWNGNDYLFKHQHNGDLMTGACHEVANLVVGHEHGKFGIGFKQSTGRQYWSLYAGCGVDEFSLAMAYGKEFKDKPIVGCAVIVDGVPHVVPMRMDDKGRWDKTVG